MNTTMLTNAALVVGALCAGAIALSIAYRFIVWLVGALLAQARLFVETVHGLLVRAACAVGRGLRALAMQLAEFLWDLVVATALLLLRPFAKLWVDACEGMRRKAGEQASAWRRPGAKTDRSEEADSNEDGAKSRADDAQGGASSREETRQPPPESGSYEFARAVMGFTGAEPATITELKLRYRQIIGIVHSDRGFPNTLFAQQVNDALRIIKKARGWR